MIKQLLAATAAFLVTGASAQAAEILATFDDGREGFRLSNGSLTRISTNGNPGGNLQLADLNNQDMILRLPEQYIVPISLGDTLSFDVLHESPGLGTQASFGSVTITSTDGQSLTDDFFSTSLTADWQTVQVTFDDESWRGSESELQDILSNLASITINVDASNGDNEVIRIDNVLLDLAEVPLPGAAWLFVPMAGVFLARRRRSAH
ncbi:MAG: laminin B domain-containing protein [Pseudomonadota bacterium]